MRRFAWLAATGVMTACGLASALGACGSDDPVIGPATDASAGSSGSSGSRGDSSAATDSGTSRDAGTSDTGTDAASDAATDSGLASNPGQISCGNTTCTAATQDCCRTLTDAGCITTGDPCTGGASLTCDEKADCPAGMLCCQSGLTGTACKADCAPGIQICKTGAECSGGTCYVNSCTGLGSGVIIIPACTKIPQCTQ